MNATSLLLLMIGIFIIINSTNLTEVIQGKLTLNIAGGSGGGLSGGSSGSGGGGSGGSTGSTDSTTKVG
jgi:hypothetical protein